MATAANLKKLVAGRAFTTFVVICTLLVITTGPVFATYDWCSKDPVLTFQPAGSLLPEHAVDVQVRVAGRGIVTNDTATLTVALPSNRVGQDVFPVVSDAFNLDVQFKPVLSPATSSDYKVQLSAFFPDRHGDLPVQLVITAPGSASPVACDGVAGKIVRASIAFDSSEVSCQRDGVLLP